MKILRLRQKKGERNYIYIGTVIKYVNVLCLLFQWL